MKEDRLPARLYNLDLIRGLASLSVVIWHWQHFFHVAPGELADSFQRNQQPFYGVLYPFYEHGMMAVALFFVLSGFVFFWMYERKIADGSCTPWSFLVLRVARLYPLHLLTLNMVALLQYLYYAQVGHFFVYPFNDAYHYFLHIVFASDWRLQRGGSFNSPVWSVSIEVLLYAIFFLLCYTRQTSWWKLLLIVAIAFGLTRYRVLTMAPIPREPLAAEGFFIGGLTYYIVHWYLPRRTAWVDSIIVTLTVVAWLSIGLTSFASEAFLSGDRLFAYLIFALTISALVLIELRHDSFAKKLSWIGDTTYSTYLLHFPLQLVFVNLSVFFGLEQQIYLSPFALFGFFLILMPASVVSYQMIERPLQSWIRNHALALQGLASKANAA